VPIEMANKIRELETMLDSINLENLKAKINNDAENAKYELGIMLGQTTTGIKWPPKQYEI